MLFVRLVIVAGLLGASVFSTTMFGQEWTRFRGPNGSGNSDAADIPVAWTEQDYRWRVTLPDVGHSSPVIWGQRVYVTAGGEKNGERIVCCLDVRDGKTVWTKRFPSFTHPKNKFNAYAASTPAIDGQRLYLSWGSPKDYLVMALDPATGKELWRRDLGPFDAEHGFGSSPILVGDILVAVNEQNGPSSVVGLDCRTGAVRWTAPRRSVKAAYSTPCVYQPAGGAAQLIVTSWAHGVSSLDPQSGKANWELPLFKLRVVGSPLVTGDLILASCGGGGAGKQFLAVRAGAPGREPKMVYEVKPPVPYVPAPIADKERAYLWGDGGVVRCLSLADGKPLWDERVGGRYFSSPLLIAGRIYCVAADGQVTVLAAADKYKLLGRSTLGETCHSTPAVADGVLYLRSASHLMALGPKR